VVLPSLTNTYVLKRVEEALPPKTHAHMQFVNEINGEYLIEQVTKKYLVFYELNK